MVELYINNSLVDISNRDDFPIALNRTLTDANNVSVKRGEYSYTMKLPLTKTNLSVFGNLNILASTNKWNGKQLFEAKLYANSILMFEGTLYIQSVSNKELSCVLISNTIDWANTLKSKSLKDITSLKEIDFEGLKDVLSKITELGNQLNDYYDNDDPITYFDTNDVCFPLVSYGNYFIPNSWELIQRNNIALNEYADGTYTLVNGNKIYGKDTYTIQGKQGNTYLTLNDYPPSVSILNILRAIFQDIGYTLSGSFVQDKRTKLLILPFADKDIQWNYAKLGTIVAKDTNALDNCGAAFRTNLMAVGGGNYVYDNYHKAGYGSDNPAITDAKLVFDIVYQNITNFNDPNFFTCGFNVIPFTTLVQDYLNVLEQLPIINPPIGDNERGTLIRINKTAEYRLVLDIDIIANDGEYTTLPYKAIGISRMSEGDKFPERPDGSYLQALTTDGIGWENVVAIFDCTSIGTGIKQLESEYVRLERGDVLFVWLGVRYDFDPSPVIGGTAICDASKWNGTDPCSLVPLFDFKRNSLKLQGNTQLTLECRDLQDKAANYQFTDKLKTNVLLPNIKQSEFVKSLINIFNLYVTVNDKDKIISFDFIDNYYLPNDFAIDITKRCNEEVFNLQPNNLVKRYLFKWNKDTDDANFINRYKDNVIRIEGTDFYTDFDYIEDTDITFNSEIKVVDSGVLTPVSFKEYKIVNDVKGDFVSPLWKEVGRIVIPTIATKEALATLQNESNDNKRYDLLPKICSLGRYDTIDNSSVGLLHRYFDITQPLGSRDIFDRYQFYLKCSWNWDTQYPDNTINTSDSSYSLSYGNLVNTFVINNSTSITTNVVGLYANYYQLLIDRFKYGEIVDLEVMIDYPLYKELQLNRLVQLNGVLYYIIAIKNFNILKPKPTKVTVGRII